MTYQVPASKASIKQNQFEFKMPAGKVADVAAAKKADPALFEEFEAARKKWEAHVAQFEKADTRTYSIPKMQFLRPNLVDKIDPEAPKVDVVRDLLEHYHPGFWDRFDDMSQALGFFEAWQAASGTELGESSASTDS